VRRGEVGGAQYPGMVFSFRIRDRTQEFEWPRGADRAV
jgi:hypothetical protein